MFVIEPVADGSMFTVMVAVVEPDAGIVPRLHVTSPADTVHPLIELLNVNPAASGSVTVTPSASDGPPLDTVNS